MVKISIGIALVAAATIAAVHVAKADLPLDRYAEIAKASRADKGYAMFLAGYFEGLAAGLEQLDVARQNPNSVDFCLPAKMPMAPDQIRTLVDGEIARGTFAAPPSAGGRWPVSIVARAALARLFPCPQ